MTSATIDDPSDTAPGPGLVEGLDDLAAALRELRAWAGNPSFAQIARDVARVRTLRGVPQHEAATGRVTVYDCFRDGRRRINVDLVVDIASALGADADGRALWRLATRTAIRPAARVVPSIASLPDAPEPFVGRESVLARLTAHDAPRMHVLHGLPGTGKSAMAVTAAHRLVGADAVDLVVHVELTVDEGGLDPFEVMAQVLRTHRPGESVPAQPAARRSAYTALLAAQPTLLIFDDVASPSDVEPLLPPEGATRVIATSRWDLAWDSAVERIALTGLSAPETGRLLSCIIGDTPIDDESAAELHELSGGLPLAVMLIGSRMAKEPSWSLREQLDAYRDQLRMLQLDDGIHGALAITYAELDDVSQRVLRLLALHPSREFSVAAAAALVDEPELHRALEVLGRAHLLRPLAADRWQIHALVRVFARRAAMRSERPGDRAAAADRILDHYLTSATAAVSAVHPAATGDWPWFDASRNGGWSMEDGAQWLRRERATLLTTASWAAEHHFGDKAMRLASVLTWHLWDGGEMSAALSLQQACRATAITAGDREAEALAERNLGMTHVRISNYDQARPHLDRALAINEELGNHGGLASVLNASSIVSATTGDYERAANDLTRAVDLYRELGDADHECGALVNLAVVTSRAGDQERSVELAERSAAIAAEHGWIEREKWARNNIASVLADSGDPSQADRAIRAATRAAQLAHQQGDELGMLYANVNLATARHVAGDVAAAHALASEMLQEARRLTVPDLIASIYNNLGDMFARDADLAAAREHYQRALQQAEAIGEALEKQRAKDGLAAADTTA